MSARTCVILNPAAGTSEQAYVLHHEVARRSEVRLFETRSAGDARTLATQALDEGFERIVAAGGDGTVNEIVNGSSADPLRAVLAIIPLGTGNDLPRTLDIPVDPAAALELLDLGEARTIDLFCARWNDTEMFGVNVAAGGFTGQMNEVMTDELKATWGPLAYLRGAIKVIPDLTHYSMQIRYDGSAWSPLTALNVIVANARSAGGGTQVAPAANPEDGLLDIVVVRPGTLAELTGVAARLLAGNYLNSDVVTHRRAKRVEIQSVPGMWFNIDGELMTNAPITFTVVPRALRVIVGPGYSASVNESRAHGDTEK